MNNKVQGNLILFLLLFQLIYISPAYSCTTPVFRYALERWEAYQYIVEIFHDGNLNDEQNSALELLKGTTEGITKVNLKIVEIIDFEQYKIQKKDLPLVRLRRPIEHPDRGVIWQGALTKENILKIIDSPARREIYNRIRKGDAITWIFLESDNPERNRKAGEILKNELIRLSEDLQLPSSATDANGNPLDINIVNRGVNFTMIKISRSDPEEEIFIKMLLATEPDLPFVNAPLAFPMFGRGRVLYALVGSGIKEKLIEIACNSVIGWCSCTVKEDNPGSDLLLYADWESAIGDSTWIQELELPEITGLSEFVQEEDKQVNNVELEKDSETGRPGERSNPDTEESSIQEIVQNKELQKTVPEDSIQMQREEIISTQSSDKLTRGFSPLLRNIGIIVLLLIIVLPSISYFYRKKKKL